TELAIMDDPLSRDAGVENTQASRRNAAKGRGAPTPADASLFRKPHLDEMGTSGAHAVPVGADSTLFRKNSLDEMTVRRTEKPVGKPEIGRASCRERV